MDKMQIKFPNSEDVTFEYGKPVVILGANGAGKTRFGVKIEELNDNMVFSGTITSDKQNIHRISAQKSLSIHDRISILDNESAVKDLFYGTTGSYASKRDHRFGSNPATHLLDDYNKALSLLFSKESVQLQNAHIEDKKAFASGRNRLDPITTVVEKATEIWNTLLPHRQIDLTGNGVHVIYHSAKYHGKEMSDGERVMLYMICQALVLPPNTLLIVDEPELHIHKAIVEKMWSLLEQERQDCVFMYITHDLSFALSRNTDKYIWIKNFDGNTWEYEFINFYEFSEVPAELVAEIIGSRQNILFVEGTKDSYDTALYRFLYPDYHVVPCGSCKNVIQYVKAGKMYEKLISSTVKGLIDRDFRSEREMTALREDGIYFLNVAEVENLFVVPELLDVMEPLLLADNGKAQEAKQKIEELYNQIKESQIAESVRQEIKFQLSLFKMGKGKYTVNQIKNFIDEQYSMENLKNIVDQTRQKFDSATTLNDILRVFNFKNLANNIIGTIFGLNDWGEYPRRVLRALAGKHKAEVITAIREYVPDLDKKE